VGRPPSTDEKAPAANLAITCLTTDLEARHNRPGQADRPARPGRPGDARRPAAVSACLAGFGGGRPPLPWCFAAAVLVMPLFSPWRPERLPRQRLVPADARRRPLPSYLICIFAAPPGARRWAAYCSISIRCSCLAPGLGRGGVPGHRRGEPAAASSARLPGARWGLRLHRDFAAAETCGRSTFRRTGKRPPPSNRAGMPGNENPSTTSRCAGRETQTSRGLAPNPTLRRNPAVAGDRPDRGADHPFRRCSSFNASIAPGASAGRRPPAPLLQLNVRPRRPCCCRRRAPAS